MRPPSNQPAHRALEHLMQYVQTFKLQLLGMKRLLGELMLLSC